MVREIVIYLLYLFNLIEIKLYFLYGFSFGLIIENV